MVFSSKKSLAELKNKDAPFYCLEISDYNANGLTGKWNRSRGIEDRFYNLVLSINKTRKQSTEGVEGRLGSFGVGKMVFAMCSDLRCMIYYSKFKPSERSEGVGTRFMATGFFPEFTDEEKDRPYPGTPI